MNKGLRYFPQKLRPVVSGSGSVNSVTGDSVDNTDPANPVVDAIPYDATDQTQNIVGTFDVGTAGATFKIIGATVESSVIISDGSLHLLITNIATGEPTNVFVQDGGIVVSVTQSGSVTEAQISDGAILFQSDKPNFAGPTAGADYSADYASRSLTDKEYVDTRLTQQQVEGLI